MTDTNGMTMYIGPTVRGVARHGATFSGGLPSGLEKLAAAMPIMRNLIVPLSVGTAAASSTAIAFPADFSAILYLGWLYSLAEH